MPLNRNLHEKRDSVQALVDQSVLTFPRTGRFFTGATLQLPASVTGTNSYVQSVSASHEQASLEAWRALSGTGHWASASSATNKIIAFDLGVGAIVRGYTLQNGTSGSLFNLYSPRSWTFEGSDDGRNWTALHTVSNSTDTTQSNVRTFTFTNQRAFRQYRFVFTLGNEATFNQYIITQQITLTA
jgi:hypothetical protein